MENMKLVETSTENKYIIYANRKWCHNSLKTHWIVTAFYSLSNIWQPVKI